MLKWIALVLLATLFGLVGFVATRPSSYRVERGVRVDAPPAVVFEQVNDFQRWGAWSPWDKLDPNQRRTFSGAKEGQGATYEWAGNDQVGEGRMVIRESTPPERIVIDLHFLKPFESRTTTRFAFTPLGGGTEVRWSLEGTNDFLGKAFALLTDMDAMIGKDFEKGLLTLKSLTEEEAKTVAAPTSPLPDAGHP